MRLSGIRQWSSYSMILHFSLTVATLNAISLLGGSSAWHTGTSGTFDTALMAILLPLFLHKWWFLALGVVLPAIITQGEGTALSIIAVQLFFGFMRATRPFFAFPMAIGFIIPVAAFSPWKELVTSHMLRIKMWAVYLGHWWDYSPVAIGFGADTFRFRAPRFTIEGKNFAWAHNDWVEITFNHGIIGVSFAILLYFFLLYKARTNTKIFLTLLGFGTCMCFYSPLRVITGQLILIGLCFEVRKVSQWSS